LYVLLVLFLPSIPTTPQVKMLTSDIGLKGTDGNDAQNRVQQGFDMVSVITDVGVLGEGMNRHLATAAGVNHSQKPSNGY
jgi:hypothetical protein